MVRKMAVSGAEPVSMDVGVPDPLTNPRVSKLGVEEEFHIVDLETRRLTTGAARLLEQLPDGDRFKPELLDSAIEINSAVVPTLDALRADLTRSRVELVFAARSLGLGISASGTVPLGDETDTEVVRGDRNDRMRSAYQQLADEQMICGAQVHVDIPDRDLGIRTFGRMLPWLPILLAISASSPYWKGADTGYASYRTLVWQRWPTAGLPPHVESEDEYERMTDQLLATGTILDKGMIYFDVRPSAHVQTLEVRLCDAIPRIDDVVLVAGLTRALLQRATDDVREGAPFPDLPRPVLEAARWRAARTGLDGDLLDPVTGRPVPAADALDVFIDYVGDALDEAGDREQVTSLVAAALRDGGNAGRQRRAFAETGRLETVVDMLLAETVDGDVGKEI